MAEETKTTTKDGTPAETPKTYSEADYNAAQEKIRSLEQQLSEANTTIQSYTDMDIDKIKQSAADWEQKAKQAEADRAAFEHRTKLNAYVRGLHLRNEIYEAHVTQLLEGKGLKFDGDKLIGGEDIVQEFRKAHADAFLPDQNEQAAAPTSGKAQETMDEVSKYFYAKNPGLVPAT